MRGENILENLFEGPRMKESDVHKTAFRTHRGHFEFKVMRNDKCTRNFSEFDEWNIQGEVEKRGISLLWRYPSIQWRDGDSFEITWRSV